MMRRGFYGFLIVAVGCCWLWAGTPCEAAPYIYRASPSTGPGDTAYVSGEQLDEVTEVRLTMNLQPTIGPFSLDIVQRTATSLKFRVPPKVPVGIYHLKLLYPGGVLEAALNEPQVFWLQGEGKNRFAPGDRLMLFGRNIAGGAKARLVLRNVRSPDLSFVPDATDKWSLAATLPGDIADGTYRLALDPGLPGGEEDYPVGDIVVERGGSSVASQYDVRQFGATGNGRTDDTLAFRKALTAAAESSAGTGRGAVVRVPGGRYLLSGNVEIAPGVSLRGDGEDLTSLAWLDSDRPPDALIAGEKAFSVESLTIFASAHRYVISGGYANNEPVAEARDISVRHVRIRASVFRGHLDVDGTQKVLSAMKATYPDMPTALRLSGERVRIEDNDIISSGGAFSLGGGRDVIVRNNRFGNGRYGWYSISGCDRVIVEDNEFFAADLQGTGGGINTLAHLNGASGHFSTSENIVVRRNDFHDMYGWDREAMTTDGPGGAYYGKARPLDGRHVQFAAVADKSDLARFVGMGLFFVEGQGAGQWAQIVSAEQDADGVVVEVDRDLHFPPRAVATISICDLQRHYLILDNVFRDTGVAFQVYGVGAEHVIVGNLSERTGGFILQGIWYHQFQPIVDVLVENNLLRDASVYRAGPDGSVLFGRSVIAIKAIRGDRDGGLGPFVRDITVRGNDLSQGAVIELYVQDPSSPGIENVVIEKNKISEAVTRLHGANAAGIYVSDNLISTVN